MGASCTNGAVRLSVESQSVNYYEVVPKYDQHEGAVVTEKGAFVYKRVQRRLTSGC